MRRRPSLARSLSLRGGEASASTGNSLSPPWHHHARTCVPDIELDKVWLFVGAVEPVGDALGVPAMLGDAVVLGLPEPLAVPESLRDWLCERVGAPLEVGVPEALRVRVSD